MTETLVFIFLVDHLPGDILNRTQEIINVTNIPIMPPLSMQPHKCDYKFTEPLIKVIGKELDYVVEPNWLKHDNITVFDADSDALLRKKLKGDFETNYNNLKYYFPELNTASESVNSDITLDDSKENKSKEIPTLSKIRKIPGKNEKLVALFDNSKENERKEILTKIWKIPSKNEKLVAIFETLSNVTAQTCAGVLLAPNWVVTAASCVGLLSDTYGNKINSKEKSSYTIILNATDPLIDGTVHNVTKVLLNPVHEHRVNELPKIIQNFGSSETGNVNRDTTENIKDIILVDEEANKDQKINLSKTDASSNKSDVLSNTTDTLRNQTDILSNKREMKGSIIDDETIFEGNPSIALMRIDPPLETDIVEIVDDVDEAMNVVVYRWAMLEDDSGATTLNQLAFESRILPPEQCTKRQKVAYTMQKELCLASEDVSQAFAGELNWCGPVLTPSGGLVALTHAGSGSIVATPLAPYKKWIQGVIRAYSTRLDELVSE